MAWAACTSGSTLEKSYCPTRRRPIPGPETDTLLAQAREGRTPERERRGDRADRDTQITHSKSFVTRSGTNKVVEVAQEVRGMLTRLLMEAVAFQAPTRSGMFRPKMRYAHQGGMNPPVILIHGNSLENVPDAYKRFLEGRFRKAFDLVGTPLRIEFKTSTNPYKE